MPPDLDERVVHVVPCASWDDFRLRVREEHQSKALGEGRLYRGHASPKWKLASPLARELGQRSRETGTEERTPEARLEQTERLRRARAKRQEQLLDSFKDTSIGLQGIRSSDLRAEDDWWTLGRHYGLVTPLLDWTKSPYVAAFFAFTGYLDQLSPGATTRGSVGLETLLTQPSADQTHVAIWCLRSLLPEYPPDGFPSGLELVSSRTDIGHRQRAQRGVFTRLTTDAYCLEEYLATELLEAPILTQYLVPGWAVSVALLELRLMNITFSTLYPDLVGAALQANFEVAMSRLGFVSVLDADAWS